jgi:dGTPase
LRVLMRLESPYVEHDGLNLTWEMLEGLAKHNGPVKKPTWALAELDAAFPLDLASHASIEAQIAAISDDIAYDNHDIDDGLRGGFLTLDDLLELPFLAEQWYAIEARYPGAPRERLLRELVRGQIGRMVNDVIGETQRRLGESGVDSAADVRGHGARFAAFPKPCGARSARSSSSCMPGSISTPSKWLRLIARATWSRRCLPPIAPMRR